VTRDFAYTAEGLLCDVETGSAASCTGGNVASDDAGRVSDLAGWHLDYDAQGRLVSACASSSCSGTGFDRVDLTYDGAGRRTAITATPAAGSAVETTFRYQGDAIVAEERDGDPYREYVTDAAGTIHKVIVPAGVTGTGTYLVTWNGHGDAMALWRIETGGSLTLANSYTYSTWGTPTTATHNGIADLGFRFLYVGAYGVQWDDDLGLDLTYMRARHYSPSLGRFLQPDPSRLDERLFVYAENGPVSKVDPSGNWACLLALAGGPIGAVVACGLQVGAVAFAAFAAGFAANNIVRYWCRNGCNVNLAYNSSAQQAANNYKQGMEAEKRALREHRVPFRIYLLHVRFVTSKGDVRYLDICEWHNLRHLQTAPFKPIRCWEVKSGGAKYYLTDQWWIDQDIMRQYGFPIYLIHYK
jgi:RHS repeat-associated protein